MDIGLEELEKDLLKIKDYGKIDIKSVPEFEEIQTSFDDKKVDIYKESIKVNNNFEESNNEDDNLSFLPMDAPPELFIESGLITPNSNDIKNNSQDKSMSVLNVVKSRNQSSYRLCSINDCLELPIVFKKVLNDFESFYRYGVMKQFSFLHSLMCLIDPM